MIQINPLKSYIDGGVRAALTTPPSASLVFDLPGKAIWVKGVKLKGTDHTYTFNHDNYITLTNTPDKNNPESEDIKIGVNITTLKNIIDTTYNGGTLALLQEGLNTEERTWLAKILHNYINNVLPTTKNLKINGTNYAIYTTENSLPLFFVPTSLGTTGQILACTSSGLIWVDLIQNTDYRVSLSSATSNSDYRIILKQGANNNPETDFVRFSEYLTFNPYTKTLKINNIKVVTATDIYVGSNAGLVPTATSAQLNYYLRGDGAWINIATEMAAANTWRPIKVGNTDALGSGTNTGTLSFIAGTGIALSWDATNKRIIITNSSPDVNHNTDETIRQVPKTDNVNRPLMMINGSTSAGEQVTTSMFSTGIYANASTKMITANGFIKAGSSNSYVLLGDGGHKSISSIINGGYIGTTQVLTSSKVQALSGISSINGRLTISVENDLTRLGFGGVHNVVFGEPGYAHRGYYFRPSYSASGTTNTAVYIQNASAANSPTWTTTHAFYSNGNAFHSGSVTSTGFIKAGSSNSYVLLGGGDHKALSDFSMSGHTHAYLPLSGGTMTLGEGLKFHADDNYFGTYSDARIISLLDDNGTTCDGGLIIDERATYNGTEYVTELLRIRDSEFKWRGLNILHSGNYNYYSPTLTGIGATGTWNINISGNADTIDGYHASSLVKFYLSPMTSGAPADSAKSWFVNTMPSSSAAIVYNVPGAEKTIIAGKSSGAYGHMLQLNYDDNYLRILRYHGGSWKTTDWEKISAGYADLAGSVAWDNITSKPETATRWPSWLEITAKPTLLTYLWAIADSIYMSSLRWNFGEYDLGDFTSGAYKEDYPSYYGTYLSLVSRDKNCAALLAFDNPTSNKASHIFYRIRGAGDGNTTFSPWKKILTEVNTYWGTISGTNVSLTINGTTYTLTNNLHIHDDRYLKLSGGTMTGMLKVNAPIFGYVYAASNNRAAFMWDKPGSYYTGVGANGNENTIQFSACDGSGNWVDYKQYWVFKGDVTASNFYSSSDIRLKNNINNISKSIRSFNWKESGLKSYGLIALEIENEYPELVSNNDNGYKSINYTSALCMIIAKLENGLDELKEKVKLLEDKLHKYENTL